MAAADVLLDSWWYYKVGRCALRCGVTRSNRGTRTACWSGRPCVWRHCGRWPASLCRAASIFPDGLDYVRNATGWLIQGHNRYWATNNVYALQNGGALAGTA